ncbi:MAG: matrixin family metalloprotease [Candidatus Limnocylindrales bacterium]
MRSDRWRRAAAGLALPLLLTVSATPVAAATASDGMAAAVRPTHSAQVAPDACSDSAYSLLGGKWNGTLRWSFQSSSAPEEYTTAAVLTVLKRSFANMTKARNDCGLADTVGARSKYLGATSRAPGVTKRGYCNGRDGHNVVGFGPLASGILAVTCTWTNGRGKMIEADIRVNSSIYWALSASSCHYWQELLEPTMTHEIGHAFGLGHVGERKHGRLTMSTTSDGPCDNSETTLGWGDIRGLNHLYPL